MHFEEIESILLLPTSPASKIANQTLDENDFYIVGSGEKGKIRVWNSKKMTEILPVNEKKDFSITKKGVLLKEQKISHLLVCNDDDESNSSKQSIIIFQDDLLSICQFKGAKNKVELQPICSNQHEILDMVIIGDKYLVVATMSPVIKIYNLSNNKKLTVASGGHEDSVLGVNVVDEHSFVSCSKDQTVCFWNINKEDGNVNLVAKGSGHSSFVGAVACSAKFIFSASKDGILKVNN